MDLAAAKTEDRLPERRGDRYPAARGISFEPAGELDLEPLLFGEREVEHAVEWLALQATEVRPGRLQTIALACSACGYGIARPTPSDRCPMCQREATWIHRPWRPFTSHP